MEVRLLPPEPGGTTFARATPHTPFAYESGSHVSLLLRQGRWYQRNVMTAMMAIATTSGGFIKRPNATQKPKMTRVSRATVTPRASGVPMLSGGLAIHGERLEPRRYVGLERSHDPLEVGAFIVPAARREDRDDEVAGRAVAERHRRGHARGDLAALVDVRDDQPGGVTVQTRRVVAHDVHDRVAGEEVQLHLVQGVEAIGRYRERLIDRLVRLGARDVDAPAADRGCGGGTRCGRARHHPSQQTRPALGRLGGRHDDVVGRGQVQGEQPLLVVVAGELAPGVPRAGHE